MIYIKLDQMMSLTIIRRSRLHAFDVNINTIIKSKEYGVA